MHRAQEGQIPPSIHEEESCRFAASELENLLQSPKFSQVMNSEVKQSPIEIFASILQFSIVNTLSLTALKSIFSIINNIFHDSIFPESRYMLNKIFHPTSKIEYHAVCSKCSMYLGCLKEISAEISCRNCRELINVSHPSYLDCFVTFDISQDIIDLLQTHPDFYEEIVSISHQNGHYKDIYDGRRYRKFVDELPEVEKKQYVTVVFNTDGAQKFDSSKNTLWPIQAMINEVPPHVRFDNLITCGLWFSKKKPPMGAYLDVFVDTIKKLRVKGIPCSINGQQKFIKPYVLCGCLDCPARVMANGTILFNGSFGCDWCLHPGEHEDGSMRYPVLENISLRDTQTVKDQMILTSQNSLCYQGVLNVSPLINLPEFDVVSGFVPDPMHCIAGGVVKQITEYFMYMLSRDEIAQIDSLLLNIKAPYQAVRLTRGISDRVNWVTKDFENWCLYYSVPCLSATSLPKSLIEYWCLLVESYHRLLSHDITTRDLEIAKKKLKLFVAKTEQFFGTVAMTYNIHQLDHIVESVLSWGPLWAHQAYPFEYQNRNLLAAIKSPKGVIQQIARTINIYRSLNVVMRYINQTFPSEIVKYHENELKFIHMNETVKISANIRYFGAAEVLDPAFLNECKLDLHNTRSYKRIVKDRCFFTSCDITNERSCNFYARLKNNCFIKISKFLLDSKNACEKTLYYPVTVENSGLYEQLYKVTDVGEKLKVIETHHTSAICIYMEINNTKYICTIPRIISY